MTYKSVTREHNTIELNQFSIQPPYWLDRIVQISVVKVKKNIDFLEYYILLNLLLKVWSIYFALKLNNSTWVELRRDIE